MGNRRSRIHGVGHTQWDSHIFGYTEWDTHRVGYRVGYPESGIHTEWDTRTGIEWVIQSRE